METLKYFQNSSYPLNNLFLQSKSNCKLLYCHISFPLFAKCCSWAIWNITALLVIIHLFVGRRTCAPMVVLFCVNQAFCHCDVVTLCFWPFLYFLTLFFATVLRPYTHHCLHIHLSGIPSGFGLTHTFSCPGSFCMCPVIPCVALDEQSKHAAQSQGRWASSKNRV